MRKMRKTPFSIPVLYPAVFAKCSNICLSPKMGYISLLFTLLFFPMVRTHCLLNWLEAISSKAGGKLLLYPRHHSRATIGYRSVQLHQWCSCKVHWEFQKSVIVNLPQCPDHVWRVRALRDWICLCRSSASSYRFREDRNGVFLKNTRLYWSALHSSA